MVIRGGNLGVRAAWLVLLCIIRPVVMETSLEGYQRYHWRSDELFLATPLWSTTSPFSPCAKIFDVGNGKGMGSNHIQDLAALTMNSSREFFYRVQLATI